MQAWVLWGRRFTIGHFSSMVALMLCDCELKSAQGMYAGEVGVPRLLKLFDKYKIKTTWFIPGWFQVQCSRLTRN